MFSTDKIPSIKNLKLEKFIPDKKNVNKSNILIITFIEN